MCAGSAGPGEGARQGPGRCGGGHHVHTQEQIHHTPPPPPH